MVYSSTYVNEYTEGKIFNIARSPQAKNQLPQCVGHLTSTCSNATELIRWAAPSYSQPQSATDNSSIDVTAQYSLNVTIARRKWEPQITSAVGGVTVYESVL